MNNEIIYATVENVLKEAGFLLESRNEMATGAIDGTNKVFFTAHKPLYDVDSIIALVDSVNGEIASVDAEKGQISLNVAPVAATKKVTITYRYSAIDLDFVDTVIADAQAWVNSMVEGYDPCYPYSKDKIPRIISLVTRIYAGGLLLTRDYGYKTDTELTSKDGYKKIQLATDTLTKYIENGGCSGGSDDDDIDTNSGIGSISAASRGNLFGPGPDHGCGPCSDKSFDRNLC